MHSPGCKGLPEPRGYQGHVDQQFLKQQMRLDCIFHEVTDIVSYYFPFGGLFPRCGPDGFGVLLGAFGGALLAENMTNLLLIWVSLEALQKSCDERRLEGER